MSKLKAKIGRPAKYDFESWDVDQFEEYEGLQEFHRARQCAYQFAKRSGRKFSAGKRGVGGYVARIE